jgi:hypothetical protein
MRYGAILALLLAAAVASAQATPPVIRPPAAAPKSLDELLSDLEKAGKAEKDALAAKAAAKKAVEDEIKALKDRLKKQGIDFCPPALPPVPPPKKKDPEPPPTDPKAKADPVAATGRIQFGNAGCTATVMWPRRPDGKWDVLTAAHCTSRGVGSRGVLYLKDGRRLGVTVTARATGADISWLVTDDSIADMPFAVLASADPPSGTRVWHMGYGVDNPGNREEGEVLGRTSEGQMAMRLSVSSGDSGSGVFRADTGELIATVCCTTGLAQRVTMYGGSAETAARLRPRGTSDTGGVWTPIDIPLVVPGH